MVDEQLLIRAVAAIEPGDRVSASEIAARLGVERRDAAKVLHEGARRGQLAKVRIKSFSGVHRGATAYFTLPQDAEASPGG